MKKPLGSEARPGLPERDSCCRFVEARNSDGGKPATEKLQLERDNWLNRGAPSKRPRGRLSRDGLKPRNRY